MSIFFTQFRYQLRDLPRNPGAGMKKRNAHSGSRTDHQDVAGHPEVELIGFKAHLDLRSPFEIDRRRFDEASREAHVSNTSGEPQTAMRQRNLGLAFAAITHMPALLDSQFLRLGKRRQSPIGIPRNARRR